MNAIKKPYSELINIPTQKHIYLYLLDNDYSPLWLVKKRISVNRYDEMYANVRRLSELDLIEYHYYLEKEQPTNEDLKKARGINLTLKDKSDKALVWALTEEIRHPKNVPMDINATQFLKEYAERKHNYITYWNNKTDLFKAYIA